MAITYILIIAAVLVLLNTYPLIVSQNLVFRSKVTELQNNVSVVVSSLSGLDDLTEKNVAQAMMVTEDTSAVRILVTDEMGKVLYDNREGGSCVGDYALYTEIVQALKGNDAAYSYYEDGAFRSCAAWPVIYRGRIIGAAYVYEYETEQAELLSGLQNNLLRISLVTGLLVLILSLALSKLLSARFGKLLSAIQIVRCGDYHHRAKVDGKDEISELAAEFNSLTDRLEVTENVRRRFVADASHELKTPLASIRLLSDSILQTEEMDGETVQEFVGDIRSESDRLQRITEELIRLTKLDGETGVKAAAVSVEQVADRVIHMLQMLAKDKDVTLVKEIGENCIVCATEDDFYQILYNLVENAIKYNHPGGFVKLSLAVQEKTAAVRVEDNGIGIPEEDLDRIFDRFYRVDKARSRAAGGTGLGLSIVRDTARRYGGDVTAGQNAGGGSVFTVLLPLWRDEEKPS